MVENLQQSKFVKLFSGVAILLMAVNGCKPSAPPAEAFQSILAETNPVKREQLIHLYAQRGSSIRPFLLDQFMSFDDDKESVSFDIFMDQPDTLAGLDFTRYFAECPKYQLIIGSIIEVLGKVQPEQISGYLQAYLNRKDGSSQTVELFVRASYVSTIDLIKSGKLPIKSIARLARMSKSKYWTDPKRRLLTEFQLNQLQSALDQQLKTRFSA